MEDIEEILERCGAFLKGHFVLASSRHSGEYIDKFKIYENKQTVSDLCQQIANDLCTRFSNFSGNRIEVVIGPERGGKILAQNIADHLRSLYPWGSGRVLARFTKKDKEGNQFLEEKYKKDIAKKKVLIVDDILTTGGTVKLVIEEVRKAGGYILGLAVVCNRGDVQSKDISGVPILAQFEVKMEDWSEGECPLCQKDIPVNTKVGRGKEFLAKKAR